MASHIQAIIDARHARRRLQKCLQKPRTLFGFYEMLFTYFNSRAKLLLPSGLGLMIIIFRRH